MNMNRIIRRAGALAWIIRAMRIIHPFGDVISLQYNEKRGVAPFVRRSNGEHHGFCPTAWAKVINECAGEAHELIRLAGLILLTATLGQSLGAAPLPSETLTALQAAKPGATIALPAGTFQVGDLAIPAGVTLKGAGYNKTILDAKGKKNGLVLGAGSSVSDLAINNAAENGIFAQETTNNTVARVSVSSCVNGLLLKKTSAVRVENSLFARNRAGLVIIDSKDCVAANLTLANNSAMGLLVSDSSGVKVFNNLVVFCQIGVRLDGVNPELALDNNIYVCGFTGSLGGAQGKSMRKKVEAWSSFSGQDKHSLMLPVTLDDDYRVTSCLAWAPPLTSTALWGVKELAGATAPTSDLDGKPRGTWQGVGAFASIPEPVVRKADGTFEVKSGAGVTSAGLYTPSGDLVAYLFQNQPLAKGTYDYWIPSRNWRGEPIAAGTYELKVTEADLSFEYVSAAGNGDEVTSKNFPQGANFRASLDPEMVEFGPDGQLFLAQGGFETGEHLRSFSPDLRSVHWSLPGVMETAGLASDDQGRLFILHNDGVIIRLVGKTGEGVPFPGGSVSTFLTQPWTKTPGSGMVFFNGKLVTADPDGNQLVLWDGETLERTGQIALDAPSWPSVDKASGLLWVIRSGKELVALDTAGQIKATATPVAEPTRLAVANGRLAVYSKTANQVSIFNCANPAALTLLRVVGQGGSVYGPIQPDRFSSLQALALSPAGDLAVVDVPRVMVFNPEGKVLGHSLAMWGQRIPGGQFANDDRMHFFEQLRGNYDIALDAKTQTWTPGSFWKFSMPGMPVFFFAAGGKTFCVAERANRVAGFLVYEMDPATGLAKAVARYGRTAQGLITVQKDANKDGIITDDEPVVEIVCSVAGVNANNPFAGIHTVRFRPDATMVITYAEGPLVVPMTGLDADGVPVFAFDKATLAPVYVGAGKDFLSPYDFTTQEEISIRTETRRDSRGNFIAGTFLKGGPGNDLGSEHYRMTDVVGFAPDGHLRWLNPLNPMGLKEGFTAILNQNDITLAARGTACEFETMDADGLGTGLIGMPLNMAWRGMWLDNPRQSYSFTGNDGKDYLILGDYSMQCFHWLEIKGLDAILHNATSVAVSADLAQTLATAAPSPVPNWPVPPVAFITIAKLAAPLAINGDSAKWRSLGIKPLLITPELAFKTIGAENNSAVVRLAYQGNDLYAQIIKFDDTIALFQKDTNKHYLQDGIELVINSYPEGFKYNVTVLDGQPVIFRDTWRANYGHPEYNVLLTPEVAPRSIKILDDTASVEPERQLLESATGRSLANAKAMVIEFKIPQSAMTPMQKPEQEVVFASGKGFQLGFMINDNDIPGVDDLNPIAWPSTYGTFERPDRLAPAVFE